MKRLYKHPSIAVVKLDMEQMICESLGVGDKTVDDPIKVQSKGFSFDDDAFDENIDDDID